MVGHSLGDGFGECSVERQRPHGDHRAEPLLIVDPLPGIGPDLVERLVECLQHPLRIGRRRSRQDGQGLKDDFPVGEIPEYATNHVVETELDDCRWVVLADVDEGLGDREDDTGLAFFSRMSGRRAVGPAC